jgi:hypothetical protein
MNFAEFCFFLEQVGFKFPPGLLPVNQAQLQSPNWKFRPVLKNSYKFATRPSPKGSLLSLAAKCEANDKKVGDRWARWTAVNTHTHSNMNGVHNLWQKRLRFASILNHSPTGASDCRCYATPSCHWAPRRKIRLVHREFDCVNREDFSFESRRARHARTSLASSSRPAFILFPDNILSRSARVLLWLLLLPRSRKSHQQNLSRWRMERRGGDETSCAQNYLRLPTLPGTWHKIEWSANSTV